MTRKLGVTAAGLILLGGLFPTIWANDLKVKLKQGTLIGIEKTNRLTKEPYYAFLSIPYAKPPVGEKRFKDPERPLPWNGILNATQEGSACMTYNPIFKFAEGNEDCLNLNIFTPKKPQDAEGAPRPVMVWIHGGAFIMGSGRPSDYGPDILMQQDIILVNINYRLNVFGFLSLQNDVVPGNAGLKDQVMALRWIKENIRAFGGDPDCVTIFGESAGGASVHYLMLSPSAKGLFHRAIAQSGVALNPWASAKHVLNTAFEIGRIFDCNTKNAYELLDCLQHVKANDLVAYQFNILSMKSMEFLTKNINLPCVEPKTAKNGFLKENPRLIIEQGNFNDVPFLLGVCQFETLLLDALFSEDSIPDSIRRLIIDTLNKKPELLLPRNLVFESLAAEKKAGKKMKEFYFQDKPIYNETVDNLINATTDSWFFVGVHDAATLHSQFGKSPVYLYDFVLDMKFGESHKAFTTSKKGPSHADDLKYFLYVWDKDVMISPEAKEIILKVDSLWVNFAKYGNPTPPDNTLGVTWKPFTPSAQSYLEIGKKFIPKVGLEKERMDFWRNLTQEENLTYIEAQ